MIYFPNQLYGRMQYCVCGGCCPFLNWRTVITIHVLVSWAVPSGFNLCNIDGVFTLLQNNLCSGDTSFFLSPILVMLCVYFGGRGAYLGLHTFACYAQGTGLQRTSDAEVFTIYCLWQCSTLKQTWMSL